MVIKMIKFKYDKNGNLIAYKNGKTIGKIETMGDNVKGSDNNGNRDKKRKDRK